MPTRVGLGTPEVVLFENPDLRDCATRQLGLLTRSQAGRFGVSGYRWKAALGRELELVMPGVARWVDAPESAEQRVMAAVLVGGAGALAARRTALRLHGVELEAPDVEVLVLGTALPRPRPGTTFHRTRDREDLDPSECRGVPCTSAFRSLVDAAPLITPDDLDRALTQLVVQKSIGVDDAGRALERHLVQGRTGAGALGDALARWPPGVDDPDSVLEVEFARLLVTAGLDGYHFHRRVLGMEVDFAYPDEFLVVETDGFEFHSSREAFESDRLRDARLVAAGWRVMRVTWRQLRNDAAAVMRRVHRALTEGRSARRS